MAEKKEITQIKVGFIGVGKMGEAILKGVVEAAVVSPENVYITDISEKKLYDLQRDYRVNPVVVKENDYSLITEKCDVVITAVKPQSAAELLTHIGNRLKSSQILISIMGGLDIAYLRSYVPEAQIVRVMPNTPMAVREGCAGISFSKNCTEEAKDIAFRLFNSLGKSYEVTEPMIDALTGISGCGPAFCYLFIEALADGGVEMGLPRQMATELAAQTLVGAGKMVLNSGKHPGQLKDDVCSPGGGTIAGVHTLEDRSFRAAAMSAVRDSVNAMLNVGKNCK